mmetsp:Transcript_11720/g.16960  ORF Transcript_11720/g.16960 Transcript_11720/m.16960 type:complete len:107 (-) Transcript_11720:197-517(-)
MLLQGKLHQAVRYVTECNKGGRLGHNNTCTKTGKPVLGVLQSKHPEAQEGLFAGFNDYDHMPAFIDLQFSEEHVAKVAAQDLVALMHLHDKTGYYGLERSCCSSEL